MTTQYANPPELFNSVQYGFSQVASSTAQRIVSVAGQVAWTANEEMLGCQDLYDETAKCLENLTTALAAVDAQLKHVMSLRIYIVDYRQQESELITRALKQYFPEGHAPTATWVGVVCLANPDFRIEIEATAAVPIE